MTKISYFGKQNLALGSVVPLAVVLTVDSEASIYKNCSSILGVTKFSEKVTTVLNACVWVVISPCNDLGWIQMIHGIFPKTPPLSPGLQIS